MRDNVNERIRLFFLDVDKVDKYLVAPRDPYSKIQRVSRLISNITPSDLVVKVCGIEDCPAYKKPVDGKKVINSLHFILRGEGEFVVNGRQFHLTEGMVFCAMTNKDNTYYPIIENPWSYIFIGFGGVLADSIMHYLGFDNKNCVIPANKAKNLREDFYLVHEAVTKKRKSEFEVLACVYSLLTKLEIICCENVEHLDLRSQHVFMALEAIRNIGLNVTVEDVAKACSLNRIYLSRIIKEEVGLTLQEIIIATRLFAAQDYLKFLDAKTPISEIAEKVGYFDVKYFSKLFKSIFGVTPTEYRDRYI